jgi:hypothetical protein
LIRVKKLLGIGLVLVSLLLAAMASGAMLKVNGLVLRADGGFTPRELPRRAFAPIDFEGWAEVKAVKGGVPPALRQVVLDFDRDGRLSTNGLATCSMAQVENATPRQARATCPRAIVGKGKIEAIVARPEQAPALIRSPLTIFNGPRQGGNLSIVAHARFPPIPTAQTFAIAIPVERRGPAYSYRVVFDIPPIADGYGALTRAELRIGKRFRSGGVRRSYVSARCSDGILETHGRFTFAEGTIIDGSVEKPCQAG